MNVLLTRHWDATPKGVYDSTRMICKGTAECDIIGVWVRQNRIGRLAVGADKNSGREQLPGSSGNAGDGTNNPSDRSEIMAAEDTEERRAYMHKAQHLTGSSICGILRKRRTVGRVQRILTAGVGLWSPEAQVV